MKVLLIVLLCLIAVPAYAVDEVSYDGVYDISMSNENGQYFTTENTPLKIVIYNENWILLYDTKILLTGNIIPTVKVLFLLNGTKVASVNASTGKGNTVLNRDEITFKPVD